MPKELYTQGDYLENNPTWHAEDSPWKAQQIIKMVKRNNIRPKTVCEVGCGAGEILRQLQLGMDQECVFWGYEISPQAFDLSQKKANERLRFELKDILQEKNASFDLVLVIDVIEHLEDYFSFLRMLRPRGEYKLFHIPLYLSVQAVLRSTPLIVERKSVGHIHYFTKDIALQLLEEVRYKLVDWFYTPGGFELPGKSVKSRIARLPRKLFFRIHNDLAVRIMGGCSLMVLAR